MSESQNQGPKKSFKSLHSGVERLFAQLSAAMEIVLEEKGDF